MSDFDSGEPLRLLIVEDSVDVAENIAEYMESLGHLTDFALNGLSGLHLALSQDYDVIILDVMLPLMDGLAFCRKFRHESQSQTPILMLTARDTLADKLAGFKAGTDDYLVKPFELPELAARVEALHRRSQAPTPAKLQVADLQLDTGRLKASRAGIPIVLNRACLKLLAALMKASPDVVPRKDLEYTLWGDAPPGSDALRSHMYTLRRLIDKPFEKPLLQTVHGIGYRLVPKSCS